MSQTQVIDIRLYRGDFLRPEVVRLPAVPRVGDRIKTGDWAWGTVKEVSWIIAPAGTDSINPCMVLIVVEGDGGESDRQDA